MSALSAQQVSSPAGEQRRFAIEEERREREREEREKKRGGKRRIATSGVVDIRAKCVGDG